MENKVDCLCDPDEGAPCEDHAEPKVMREGASLRTGDEGAMQLIDDCVELGAKLDEVEIALASEARRELATARWIEDEGLSEELNALAVKVRGRLPDDLVLVANDGYVIYKLKPGCPLLDDPAVEEPDEDQVWILTGTTAADLVKLAREARSQVPMSAEQATALERLTEAVLKTFEEE